MPRKSKPPRLWLHDRGSRGKHWIILHKGRQISTGCLERRAEEAQKRLAAYIAQIYDTTGECRSAKVLIADVLLHYVRHKSATETTKLCVSNLDAFFLERKVSDLNGALYRKYKDARLAGGRCRKETTVRRELGVLQAALKFWHGEFGLDPLPKVVLPPPGSPRSTWMTKEQFDQMLLAARDRPECEHLVRFMLITVYSGTRPDVLMRLRWLPSPNAGYVDIERGVLYRRGEDEKETKKRRPPSRIHIKLLDELKGWREADLERGITHVIHFRGEPIKSIKKSWALVREAAGLGKQFVPYSLKHTAATWLMHRGVDRWEAAGFLGVSADVLEDVYAHHDPEFQKKAAGFAE